MLSHNQHSRKVTKARLPTEGPFSSQVSAANSTNTLLDQRSLHIRSETTLSLMPTMVFRNEDHVRPADCVILTVDDLVAEGDRGGQIDIILSDFAKAFDKVPHQHLLKKLDYYGIWSPTLRRTESFLSSRTQEVVIPCRDLSLAQHFPIYISDLSNNNKSRGRLFADDTIICSTVRTPSDCSVSNVGLISTTWRLGNRHGRSNTVWPNAMCWLSQRRGIQ